METGTSKWNIYIGGRKHGPTLFEDARLFRMLMTCFTQTFNSLRVECMDGAPVLAGWALGRTGSAWLAAVLVA